VRHWRYPGGAAVWVVLFAGLAAVVGLPVAAVGLPEPDDWIQLETENFTLFSNAPEEHTREVGRDLEVFRAVLARYLEGAKVESPLPTYVYIFRDDRALQPYKHQVNGAPAEVSGFFAGHPHGNYVAVNGDPSQEPQRIVYHEYLHYFARLNLPDLPLWLNEGLAEYYSTFAIVGDEARVGLPVESHVHWLRREPLLPFEELLAVETSSRAYNEGERRGAFYASAWALVHYLLSDSERYQQLMDFLDRLEAQGELATAFEQAFGAPFATLEREVARYAEGEHFRFIPLDLSSQGAALTVPATTRLRPMTRAAVYFRLGDLLAHTGKDRTTEAARHFHAALDADPQTAQAYAGLGFLKDQAGSYEEALAYYEQALQRGGDDFLIHFLHGWTLLRSLGLNDGFFALDLAERERGVIEQAKQAFERSLKRNPLFAEALAGLGAALTFEPEPSPRAVAVLEKALHALPERVDVAFNLMVVQARRGQMEAARRVLERSIAPQASPEVLSQARDTLRLAQLNAADRLAAAGDLDGAVALVEQILITLEDTAMVREVEAQLAEMRRVRDHNRSAERYNEAVTLANAGRTAEAVAVLEGLLADRPTPELRRAAAGLLAQLRRRLP